MSFRINDPRHFGIASRHAGGAQVAFVDGHTEFLTDATDPRVVQAMMTINGGEDVSGLLDTR
jgi:prepilin-type processing-associated H-X9-DG protein